MNHKLAFTISAIAVIWVMLPIILSSQPRNVLNSARRTRGARTVNYFTAGLLNQPEPAFEFLTTDVGLGDNPAFAEEDLVMVRYQNDGLSFQGICWDIEDDIAAHGYTKVRLFGISLGTKVGHYFAAKRVQQLAGKNIDGVDLREIEIECYDINPCWTPDFLKPQFRWLLRIAVVPLSVVEVALGPISLIPFIPVEKDKPFSIRLAMSQLRRIAYRPPKFWRDKDLDSYCLGMDFPEPEMTAINSMVRTVILSDLDEFLDNETAEERYDCDDVYEKIVWIESHHGDTIGAGQAYREALDGSLPREGGGDKKNPRL